MRSWLPPGHLAWQVLGAVGELDLSGFTAAYRADGQGQAPYDPAMMLPLVLYCYFRGIRPSRKIAAACVDDVGCRVICGGATPSHQAVAQFLRRHRAEAGRLFVQVLGLLAAAGAVEGHCAAVDGSPVSGNASRFGNLDQEQLEARIAALQAAIDAAAEAWLAGAGETDGAGSQQRLPWDDDDDDDGPDDSPGGGVPRRLAAMAATLARLHAAQDKLAARRQAAPPRSPDARIVAARDAVRCSPGSAATSTTAATTPSTPKSSSPAPFTTSPSSSNTGAGTRPPPLPDQAHTLTRQPSPPCRDGAPACPPEAAAGRRARRHRFQAIPVCRNATPTGITGTRRRPSTTQTGHHTSREAQLSVSGATRITSGSPCPPLGGPLPAW